MNKCQIEENVSNEINLTQQQERRHHHQQQQQQQEEQGEEHRHQIQDWQQKEESGPDGQCGRDTQRFRRNDIERASEKCISKYNRIDSNVATTTTTARERRNSITTLEAEAAVGELATTSTMLPATEDQAKTAKPSTTTTTTSAALEAAAAAAATTTTEHSNTKISIGNMPQTNSSATAATLIEANSSNSATSKTTEMDINKLNAQTAESSSSQKKIVSFDTVPDFGTDDVPASANNILKNEGGHQLTANNNKNNATASNNVIEESEKSVNLPTTATSLSQQSPLDTKPLTHVASEPAFGVQTRTQQQQKIKSYHDAKQTTVWRTESIATNPSPNPTNTNNNENGALTQQHPQHNIITGAYGGVNVGGMGNTSSYSSISSSHNSSYGSNTILKTNSASSQNTTSPSTYLLRKSSDNSMLMPRRVSFPDSDKELVTGYLEPANPWEHACLVKSISEIAELYLLSCQKHNTQPLQTVLDHLKGVDLNSHARQPTLSLKQIKLTPNDCEPLEEVFKRVQYKMIDLSECSLNEAALSALCQMIEYYEAANELDLSSNKEGMTHRGWISCTYMVGRSQELQVLNAEGNPISKLSADSLGSALNTSNMHTLKLEHCGLKGAPLTSFCCKLYHNKMLKELWLAYNDLDCTDAAHIADLLRFNHYIELVDISNNNIRDEGMMYLVQALLMQSGELERRSNLHRAAAIEDDECLSPIEAMPPVDLRHINSDNGNNNISSNNNNNNRSCDSDNIKNIEETKPSFLHNNKSMEAISTGCGDGGITLAPITEGKVHRDISDVMTTNKEKLHISVDQDDLKLSTADSCENDADDDTEETVRSVGTVKSTNPTQTAGQSMLDKLLSMNSDSSSEEGPSIISTDTLAACCSEDISVASDEVFDAATTTGTTNTSTNMRSSLPPSLAPTTAISTVINAIPTAAAAQTSASSAVSTTVMSPLKSCKSKLSPPNETIQGDLQNERNTCDINSLTEATKVMLFNERPSNGNNSTVGDVVTYSPTSSSSHCSSSSSSGGTNGNTSNNSNTLTNSNTSSSSSSSNGHGISSDMSTSQSALGGNVSANENTTSGIFEVTAEESDCINGAAGGTTSRPLDMTKNSKVADDYEDTHSTDSAFESASEGDISRHLPDEFSRLSASLESTRLDDISKEMTIETATIATESTECLAIGEEATTPSSTPTPMLNFVDQTMENESSRSNVQFVAGAETPAEDDNDVFVSPAPPKVTIAADCLTSAKIKEQSQSPIPSPTPTPPPPSTSPGGASSGMRRTESTIAYLNQSTRNHSQSSDSLCSENSLDGSTSSDHNFAEKLTKNDTLSRRHLVDTSGDATIKSQSGLKALTVWSNNLTKDSGKCIAELLSKTVSLELLNIGKNCLSNDFVATIKDSLIKNTTLTTLGLQSAHLSAKGIETLASILTFGGNSKLQRIDIRDNKLEVESLNIIAEVLKSNKTITQIDINDEPKRLTLPIVPIVNVIPPTPLPQESIGSDAHLDYARVLENVRSMCSRNEKIQAQLQAEKSASLGGGGNNMNRCRGGYYLGSRKISLTCHSRPLVDAATGTVISSVAVSTTPTPAAKLEVKRKSGVRLRSPVPSPPTISPSSSPNRSRFQVSRVQEVSPLTSPLAQIPPPHPVTTIPKSVSSTSSSCVSIPTATAACGSSVDCLDYANLSSVASSLPTSSSLPAMASATSSTQTIKRLSVSPRSRFHVSRIYEDKQVALSSSLLTPITPPLNPPPTPMLKSARKISQLASPTIDLTCFDADTTTTTTTNAVKNNNDSGMAPVVIVEPTTSMTTDSTLQSGTKDTTNTTKLSPMGTNAAALSTPSSNSSSSSTSPVSINSNSSTSSSSSASALSPAQNTKSVSASSSTTSSSSAALACDSFSDSTTDSVSACVLQDMPKSCPIAVFGDNDITLTKESAASFALSSGVAQDRNEVVQTAKNKSVPTTSTTIATAGPPEPSATTQQQRARKMSWIANPTAVDKLLTLFNTGTIFQRSASPEPKQSNNSTQSTTNNSDSSISSNNNNIPTQQQQSQLNTFMAIRKTSPPSPHWSKFSTDLLGSASSDNNISSSSSNNSSLNTTASEISGSTSALEQSRSFLDVASKQFREISKQVFRQNLSFGNDNSNATCSGSVAASTASNNSATATTTDASSSTTSTVSGNASAIESPDCDATFIPKDLKRELKENISPEHTINEETLHRLQKLAKNEEGLTAAAAGDNSDISDIEIVTHDELKDCLEQPTQPNVLKEQDLQESTSGIVTKTTAATGPPTIAAQHT